MKKLFLTLTVLLVSLLSFTGCIGVDREFADVRSNVLKNLGENFEREAEFSIGSAGIRIASWIVQLDEDEELADDMLREISNVQVAIYNRLDPQNYPGFPNLKKIDGTIARMGWKNMVRSAEGDEVTAVYVDETSETFRRILVISADGPEIIIVEVEGDLDKVVQLALKDKNFRRQLAKR